MNGWLGKLALLLTAYFFYGCSSNRTLNFYHASGNEWTAAHVTPDSVFLLKLWATPLTESPLPCYAAAPRKGKRITIAMQPLAASVYESLAEQDFMQTGIQAYFYQYSTGKPIKGILYATYSNEYGNLEGIATDSNGFTFRYHLQDSVSRSRTTSFGERFGKVFYYDRKNVKNDSITLYARDAFAQLGIPYPTDIPVLDSVKIPNSPATTLIKRDNVLVVDTLDADSILTPLFIFLNQEDLSVKEYFKCDYLKIFFDRYTLNRPVPASRGIFRHVYHVADSLHPGLTTISVRCNLGKKRVQVGQTTLHITPLPAHLPAGWHRPEAHLPASALKSLTAP